MPVCGSLPAVGTQVQRQGQQAQEQDGSGNNGAGGGAAAAAAGSGAGKHTKPRVSAAGYFKNRHCEHMQANIHTRSL